MCSSRNPSILAVDASLADAYVVLIRAVVLGIPRSEPRFPWDCWCAVARTALERTAPPPTGPDYNSGITVANRCWDRYSGWTVGEPDSRVSRGYTARPRQRSQRMRKSCRTLMTTVAANVAVPHWQRERQANRGAVNCPA